jgi:hypothetical protein
MMNKDNLTLSEIREEVVRRADQIESLKARLEALGKEIEALLDEIDEIEGVKPMKRGRKRAAARAADAAEAEEKRRGRPKKAADGTPARRGRPPKSGGAKPRKPRPPKREGPSTVDVAVEILKESGRPMTPSELAAKIEERGVVTKNTERVILMAAGRKKSRLTKTGDGNIALPGDGPAGGTES